jgi:hypothetical protein
LKSEGLLDDKATFHEHCEFVPGAWYHLVNRGIERRRIFYREDYYRKFEALLGLTPGEIFEGAQARMAA